MDSSIYPTIQPQEWPQERSRFWRARQRLTQTPAELFWRSLFLGCFGLTFFYVLINLGLSLQWLDQPFVGFLHQNRVVTKSHTPGLPAAEATIREIPVEEGDVIRLVNGEALESSLALIDYARQQHPGQFVHYTLLKRDGEVVEVALPITRLTPQRFVQIVALPVFISFVTLIIAATAVYLRFNLPQVRLFALFCLALVYFLASFPDLVPHRFFVLNFGLAFIGKITLPIFLLHFLMMFPEPRPALRNYPFLLPLIYAPLLPLFIHIPILLILPETTSNFIYIINLYTVIYTGVGFLLLLEVSLRVDQKSKRQAQILLAGLLLPLFLLAMSLLFIPSALLSASISRILEQYGFIGLPIAAAVAVIRYELFGLARIHRSPLFYGLALLLVLATYTFLLSLSNRNLLDFDLFNLRDLRIILPLALIFLGGQLLYRWGQRWLQERVQGGSDDFGVALRIFSHDLLRVKSRRELEELISWDLASDFRLRSAELVATDRPTTPFALKLPLAVSNVSLGSLFLGSKINGQDFTEQELAVLEELQKQLSLALWSIELDRAIQTTEQLTRLKSKFLANVTHELRTPLNGIINYIGFVLDDDRDLLNSEQKEHLRQAFQGSERLLQLINNILDMSKIEAGQMKLYRQPCSLVEIIARIIPSVEEVLSYKPVQLFTRVAPDLPQLQADRLRIRQILLNLLLNAAKFTDKGTISLDVYHEDNKIVLKVADTGRGIDPEILPNIFQHFATTRLTDAGQNSGPGLSLPITKSLVEMHGGRIEVESQPGQGATFTVLMPVR